MIYKLVSCLSIISLSAYGSEVKDKFDISSQTFNHPDIPISFEFPNKHSKKRDNKPEQERYLQRQLQSNLMYPIIQYAPLNHVAKLEDQQEQQNQKNQQENLSKAAVNTGRHVYIGQDKTKLDHLEPKPLKEDDNVHQKNYRSFISGHNVKAYSKTTDPYLEQGVDLFVTQIIPDYYQKQKAPKFMYYQKTKDTLVSKVLKNHNMIEDPTANGGVNFLELLPAHFNSPARQEHKKSLPYAYSLHNQLVQEKQQQTYAHPRIHLNIARSYNIANQPPEAHLPPILAKKALALTNLLLNSQNTLMLPVRKGNSVIGL